MKLGLHYIMWETVRNEMSYPAGDDNDGYIYGLYLVNLDTDPEEVLDAQWFRSEEDRNQFAETLELECVGES